MATRRITSTEKTILDKDDAPSTTSQSSSISPAVPAPVIYKLLGFTGAMIVAPLGTYYLAIITFTGSSTLAGAAAAVMANVVLIGYIIVAMKEDQSDRIEAEKKAKKGQ